jgi:quercetin dioxygenase-like cupin family protein
VLPETEGVTINNVFFTPGARTHWHTHDRGQVLHVLAGEGRVCLRNGSPETIRAGDVVFFEPGEEHWHGAAADSYLLHLAISLGGHDWLDPVTDEEYGS